MGHDGVGQNSMVLVRGDEEEVAQSCRGAPLGIGDPNYWRMAGWSEQACVFGRDNGVHSLPISHSVADIIETVCDTGPFSIQR
jgi:hypothetical protein